MTRRNALSRVRIYSAAAHTQPYSALHGATATGASHRIVGTQVRAAFQRPGAIQLHHLLSAKYAWA